MCVFYLSILLIFLIIVLIVLFFVDLYEHLHFISPMTSNSNLNGPDLGGGIYLDDNVIRVYFIYLFY